MAIINKLIIAFPGNSRRPKAYPAAALAGSTNNSVPIVTLIELKK